MEKSKRKIITLASLFLCCMAIIGVGFAAWVITGEDTEEATGSITVDTVSDERFTITELKTYKKDEVELVDKDVILGGPETTPEGAWLTYNGDKEDLEAVIVVEVKNADKQNCQVTAEVTDKTKYESLVTAGYIAEPTVSVEKVGDRKDGDVTYYIYTITVTFKWGTDFGGVNPVTYFNGLEGGSATHGDTAFNALNVITSKADLAFGLTVYAKVGSAN